MIDSQLPDQKEIKAYINQQLSELAARVGNDTPVEVNVSQTAEGYNVDMSIDHSMGHLKTAASSESVFRALTLAKENLLFAVAELEHELNPQSRDEAIHQYKNGTNTVH